MPTYRYKCKKCDHKFDVYNVPMDKRDIEIYPCTSCGCIASTRIMPDRLTFNFGENINSVVSTKPDSYWDNAEKVRLAGLEKRKQEQAEKLAYKDPATMRAINNRFENERKALTMEND